MRYVIARYNKEQRDMAYRIFVTDALKIITQNTATLSSGAYINERYVDVISRPEQQKSCNEIIDTLINKGMEVII